VRKSQRVGTKYMPELDHKLDTNQTDIIDELVTPHPKMNETKGAKHKIVASYPAYEHDAQPTQARGGIVWNKAYDFQAKGPSYLDPVPDPGLGGGR
jgi:hypothetical protein